MALYTKEKPETISAMFDSIARRYDSGNAILSLNRHKSWNRALVKAIEDRAPEGPLLDLCAGTGDIALCWLTRGPQRRNAILLDFSAEMLACARQKAERMPLQQDALTYIHANAEEIPLADGNAAAVTIAYGIRNVKNSQKCLSDAFRVLKPGGCIGILELTRPAHPLMQWGHWLYRKTLFPILGKWIAGNAEAYAYLHNSIQGFMSPDALEEQLRCAGFTAIRRQPLTFGAATLITALKPNFYVS